MKNYNYVFFILIDSRRYKSCYISSNEFQFIRNMLISLMDMVKNLQEKIENTDHQTTSLPGEDFDFPLRTEEELLEFEKKIDKRKLVRYLTNY